MMRAAFFSVHNDPVTFERLKHAIAAVLFRFREQYPNLIDLCSDASRLNMAVSVCNTLDDIRREVTASKKFSSEYESVDAGWGRGPDTHYFHDNHEKYSECLNDCRKLIDAYSIRENARKREHADDINVATRIGNEEYYKKMRELTLRINQMLSGYCEKRKLAKNSFFKNPELTAKKISHLTALRVTLSQADDLVSITVALEDSISQNKEWEKYNPLGNGELGRCLETCLSLVADLRGENLLAVNRMRR